ncbi:MAG: ATP synthase F1 subunit gamma [Planctomycetota bacterium]|nr:ATP synthase F1 subunit gamma [Planctomycetota bacterium]
MAQIREIKKRIGAVSNIERITKTMQLIATAKFTTAIQRAKATKPYTLKIRQLVAEVAGAAGDVDHPLLQAPTNPTKKDLILAISSDRGLCGAYNGNVLRLALKKIRENREDGREVVIETVGKKAIGFFKFQKIPVQVKHMLGDKPAYEDVNHIASRYIDEFIEGKYDSVHVAYMRYESNSRQIPEVKQLLPLQKMGDDQGEKSTEAASHANFEFSPSGEALLNQLLPLTVKTELFQAINDSVVSEQIMRMIAMKAATENAKDLSRLLKRQFNRARQAKITTELMEVISGSAALE